MGLPRITVAFRYNMAGYNTIAEFMDVDMSIV